MTEGTLHSTPRGRDVVLEQIRIVGLGLRVFTLVTAVVLSIITVLIVIDIVGGNAASWFDTDEWFPLAFIAFLFPFAVWRGERRFGPGFLWTLPVDRRRLALAKVFAGWVWLMTALAVVVLWQLVLAAIAGVANPQIFRFVAVFGVTAAYLFGSALILGLRYPLRWLLGAVALFVLIGALNDAIERRDRTADTWLNSRVVGVAIERATPFMHLLSLPVAAAVLWIAVSRHAERRRH